MSWNFEVYGRTEAAAKSQVNAQSSIPSSVKTMINAAIDAQSEVTNYTAIEVKTNGHLGGNGLQTVNISVRTVTLADEAGGTEG